MKGQTKRTSLGTNLLVFVLVTMLDLLLARFAVIAGPSPGVATIYFAVAFMIASTLWFGASGAIAAYIGCFIAGILSGIPANVSLYWSLADLWQVLIPLAAFRKLNADVSLRTKRDFLVFLVFCCVLNNLAGASWGSATLAIGHLIRWNEVIDTLVSWFASNLVVTVSISSLLLRSLTPHVRRAQRLNLRV
jgi:hypothetical protein